MVTRLVVGKCAKVLNKERGKSWPFEKVPFEQRLKGWGGRKPFRYTRKRSSGN